MGWTSTYLRCVPSNRFDQTSIPRHSRRRSRTSSNRRSTSGSPPPAERECGETIPGSTAMVQQRRMVPATILPRLESTQQQVAGRAPRPKRPAMERLGAVSAECRPRATERMRSIGWSEPPQAGTGGLAARAACFMPRPSRGSAELRQMKRQRQRQRPRRQRPRARSSGWRLARRPALGRDGSGGRQLDALKLLRRPMSRVGVIQWGRPPFGEPNRGSRCSSLRFTGKELGGAGAGRACE